ncbi:hypothetical protein [uncultured Mediterranean phage]|jgi:hypothetical protein|nr:hypothetical protein [uncultured Mediterranean phage]
MFNQPRRKGKKHALKQARKLEKNADEILEEQRKNAPILDLRVVYDPVIDAVDELFRKWNDIENYPIFCYLDYTRLDAFVRQKVMNISG